MEAHHSVRSRDHIHAFARQLRALREARGLTREELAEEAGVTVGTLGRLEGGGASQPGFFTVGSLAEALGVSLVQDSLFGE